VSVAHDLSASTVSVSQSVTYRDACYITIAAVSLRAKPVSVRTLVTGI
jgi:hypothetical protein